MLLVSGAHHLMTKANRQKIFGRSEAFEGGTMDRLQGACLPIAPTDFWSWNGLSYRAAAIGAVIRTIGAIYGRVGSCISRIRVRFVVEMELELEVECDVVS